MAEVSQQTPSMDSDSGFNEIDEHRPTPLCRGAIHYSAEEYEALSESPQSSHEPYDLNDEANWPSWPTGQTSGDFAEKLANGIQTADFSSVEKKDLPIDAVQVASAARRAPEEMRMSRLDLVLWAKILISYVPSLTKSQIWLLLDFSPITLLQAIWMVQRPVAEFSIL